ncbi:hypothetical protein ACJX0J_020346, partial [Zea mays]
GMSWAQNLAKAHGRLIKVDPIFDQLLSKYANNKLPMPKERQVGIHRKQNTTLRTCMKSIILLSLNIDKYYSLHIFLQTKLTRTFSWVAENRSHIHQMNVMPYEKDVVPSNSNWIF